MADAISVPRATSPLLTDDQVADFIINGYHVIEPAFTSQFHQQVYDDLQALPTISLVMDSDDAFGDRGFYANSDRKGVAWPQGWRRSDPAIAPW